MINLIALLIILALFSIFFGYVSKDLFVGLATGFFSDNAVFIHPVHEIMLDTEFSLKPAIKTLPIFVTILSFLYYNNKRGLYHAIKIISIVSLITLPLIVYISSVLRDDQYSLYNTTNVLLSLSFIAILVLTSFILDNTKYYITKLYIYNISLINIKAGFNTLLSIYKNNIINIGWILPATAINITNFFNQRLFFELYYNKFISGATLNFGGQTTKFLDKGSIEYIGPYGLEVGLLSISKKISKLDSGVITSYALYILSGLVIYLYVLNFMNIDELILIIFVSIIYILLK